MGKFTTATAISTVLVASLIFWSRNSISSKRRTTQSPSLIKSNADGVYFAFTILDRAEHSPGHSVSMTRNYCGPHAHGAYKNRSCSPPIHIHTSEDEEFIVEEGNFGYYLGGEEGVLSVGESALLPVNVPHTFWNMQPDKPLIARIRLINKTNKPVPSERFFETWAAIAYDHKGDFANVNPLQLFLTLQTSHIELDFPTPVRALIRLLAVPLAKLVGFKPYYPEYTLA